MFCCSRKVYQACWRGVLGILAGCTRHSYYIPLDLEGRIQLTFHSVDLFYRRAGTKATTAVYKALLFSLLPTVLEMPLVCAALAACGSPAVALIAASTSASFVAYTLTLTPVPL